MSAFVLIPGAGGAAWYWHLVVAGLKAAGHEAIAVELPGDADLDGCASRVVEAIGEHRGVVLVTQSLGGFMAPLVCERVPVAGLVFVNAMIPVPGETPGAWGEATGSSKAREVAAEAGGYPATFTDETYFFHDVPAALVERLQAHEQAQGEDIFSDVCAFPDWPDVPTRVIVGRDDRLFPAAFQQRVAKARLGVEAEVIAGGHLVALSNPDELVARLLAG